MRFSNMHAQIKMSSCLRDLNIEHQLTGNKIKIRTGELTSLIARLSGVLSWVEQSAVQTSFHQHGSEFQDDVFASCSLQSFVAKVQCHWLTEILREKRLRTVFQPIVSCVTDGTGIYGYEALMRGDDAGRTIDPLDLLNVARGADLLFQLDVLACRNAVLEAARYQIPTKLFINVTPTTIYNSEYHIDTVVGLLDGLGLNPRQIVLELVESEEVGDWYNFGRILDMYRDRGFEVALDDFGAGYSSMITFNRLRPDYIKIDMDIIRAVHLDAHRATLAGKLIEAAQELNIKTIAEGIESAGEFSWVRQRGVDFVQGFYISRPAAPPPFALAA
ncbi:MAG: EAL domain-containing protein [Pyrinomonadaceae bacterium]|nr:EAL domain-containing protein [Pyrinomonadaceae bacterium]